MNCYFNFPRDRPAPIEPTFAIGAEFDPEGDGTTDFETVTLTGQTEPNATVELVGTNQSVIADENGVFSFVGVALAAGPNALTMRSRDAAGNETLFNQTITRIVPFGLAEISPTNGEGSVSLTRNTNSM